jgi:hypothetical protein
MHTFYLPTGENNSPNEEDDSRSYSSWTTNGSQFSRAIEHHLGDLDDEIIQYIIEIIGDSSTDENTKLSSDQDEKSEKENSAEDTTCDSESNSH